MAVSGTSTFDLDILEMVEEAYERAGKEMRSGYDLRTARRSLNILAQEWTNRGINLWTVEQRTLPLVQGTDVYTLDPDIIDLIEHVIRFNAGQGTLQTDYQITRTSVSTYALRTTKLVQARPTEIYVDRQRSAPRITLWPVPNEEPMQLVYWILRRINDAGAYTNTIDMPSRFIPAMTSGLAYHIACKVAPTDHQLISRLETDYEKQYGLAAQEDRDRADLRIVPFTNGYF